MTLNPKQANCVEQLNKWINRQPHLPKDLGENLITRFAHSCYYDLDKAKKAVEKFIAVRGACSDLLANRDPMSAHMQKILKIIRLGHITTSNNKLLWYYQINDPGLRDYDNVLDVKLFFLASDAYLLNDKFYPEADLVVIDAKYTTLKFLTKMNISAARRMFRYQENALPIRLTQVHVVNAPPIIDKIYAVLKTFLSKYLTDLVHFHPPESETLFQYINKDDLPSDLGGSRPSMSELMDHVVVQIMGFRENLIDENLWRVTDNKSEAATEDRNFRSLAID